MNYSIDNIKKDVRICMDQNMTNDSLFEAGDLDSLMLEDMIESKILEGVERVHVSAPYHMLCLGHNFNDSLEPYWGDKESGHVMLPDDFMRLIKFKMSDWERPVYEAISTEDPQYKRQRSRIKALRGTAQRPVCALCVRPEGRVLEFYSCKSENATVDEAVYLPHPSVNEDGCVDISEHCYEAVVYMIAGLSLISCGEAEKAQTFIATAQQYLER